MLNQASLVPGLEGLAQLISQDLFVRGETAVRLLNEELKKCLGVQAARSSFPVEARQWVFDGLVLARILLVEVDLSNYLG